MGGAAGGRITSKLQVVVVGLCVLFLLGDVQAQEEEASSAEYDWDIPAQDLNAALQAVALTSNHKLLYKSELAEGKRSPALQGSYSVREAVEALLAGTDLAFEITPAAVVLIRESEEASHPALTGSARSNSDAKQLNLAAQSPLHFEASELDAVPGPSASQHGSAASPSDESETRTREEIVVTGTRLRGLENIPAPTIEFSGEELEKSGYITLEDVFDDLPQNFAEISPDSFYLRAVGSSSLRTGNLAGVSAVNLRGLGPESTLTLLNGTRRAGSLNGRSVDVAAIPLSAIERIEIVTGGRSAIYGSDAVGGVVNLITRRSFDGVELQYGLGTRVDTPHGERHQFSGIAGKDFRRGSFVVAFDTARSQPLNLVGTGLTRPTADVERLRIDVQPETARNSAFLSGRLSVNERLHLYSDAFYSDKRSHQFAMSQYAGALSQSTDLIRDTGEHYSAMLGARIGLHDAWSLDWSGSFGALDNVSGNEGHIDRLGLVADFLSTQDQETTLSSVTMVADGPLVSIAGFTPRAVIGIERRTESYTNVVSGLGVFIDADRTIGSAFGELLVPIVQDDSKLGFRRVEFSFAGRFDDYSDFGNTFNPQVGLLVESVKGVSLRGSYSKAFRAPALIDQMKAYTGGISERTDPRTGGVSPVLSLSGRSGELEAEKARTWTIGLDYEPTFAAWGRISLSYFDIDYRNRIAVPSVGSADSELILVREDRYPGLIDRNPTLDGVQELIDGDSDGLIRNLTGTVWDQASQNVLEAFPNLIVFDNRSNNIAVEKVRGLDLTVKANFDSDAGEFQFGLNGTYTIDHDRSVTATSPIFSQQNEAGKPVEFRFRANTGWTLGAYGVFCFVNYTDSYANPLTTPHSTIDSWTTVDLSLRIDGSKLTGDSALRGLTGTLSVQNVFDSDPPEFFTPTFGFLYDPTNSNPMGRYLSFRVAKRW